MMDLGATIDRNNAIAQRLASGTSYRQQSLRGAFRKGALARLSSRDTTRPRCPYVDGGWGPAFYNAWHSGWSAASAYLQGTRNGPTR